MPAQPAATVDNLISLFRNVVRNGANNNNVDTFLTDPRAYIKFYMSIANGGLGNSPALPKMVLSDRQAYHLTKGAVIANELLGLLRVGMSSADWMPGAIASVAACRPAYKGSLYAASYSGVNTNIIPNDPLASMLWGWKTFTKDDKDEVIEILKVLKTSGTTALKEVADELLTYILA